MNYLRITFKPLLEEACNLLFLTLTIEEVKSNLEITSFTIMKAIDNGSKIQIEYLHLSKVRGSNYFRRIVAIQIVFKQQL